MLERSVEQKTF